MSIVEVIGFIICGVGTLIFIPSLVVWLVKFFKGKGLSNSCLWVCVGALIVNIGNLFIQFG